MEHRDGQSDRSHANERPGVAATSSWPEGQAAEAVRLTLVVARLGELDLLGWWRSHALDRTGRYVLRRTFPRTWQAVALEVDLISAARRHEEALAGRKAAVHLFSGRLPFLGLAAAWLAEQKTRDPDPLFDALADIQPDQARQQLRSLSGDSTPGEVLGTGLKLGEARPAELEDPVLVTRLGRALASTYASMNGHFLAPYMDVLP
jgi:hypothetical protein